MATKELWKFRHFQMRAPLGLPEPILEHFKKMCSRTNVAAVFNRHAEYMKNERLGG